MLRLQKLNFWKCKCGDVTNANGKLHAKTRHMCTNSMMTFYYDEKQAKKESKANMRQKREHHTCHRSKKNKAAAATTITIIIIARLMIQKNEIESVVSP